MKVKFEKALGCFLIKTSSALTLIALRGEAEYIPHIDFLISSQIVVTIKAQKQVFVWGQAQ